MFPEGTTVASIADRVGARLEGPADRPVRGLASIEQADETDLTFAGDEKHLGKLEECRAAAVLVPADVDLPDGLAPALLRVPDVNTALAELLGQLAGEEERPVPGIAPSAVIDESAEIAADACIGPLVVVGADSRIGSGTALCAGVKIGPDVRIGDGCMLGEGAVVRRGSRIGDRVRIGCNSVIGFEGYGYFLKDGVHHPMPHAGNVVIENDVDIGACACIDRAKWGSTRIGAGSKVDNLVQIAHSVQIGEGCLIVAQTGIAGSTKLGRYVVLAGGVGVRDNIELGDGVVAAAHTAIPQSVPPGQSVMGNLALPAQQFLRAHMILPRLPDLLKRVKSLEAQLKKAQTGPEE